MYDEKPRRERLSRDGTHVLLIHIIMIRYCIIVSLPIVLKIIFSYTDIHIPMRSVIFIIDVQIFQLQ